MGTRVSPRKSTGSPRSARATGVGPFGVSVHAEDPRAQAGGKARAVRRGQMWMPAHRWVVSRTDQVRTGGAFQQTTHIRVADLPSIAHVPTGKARNALTPMQPHARARGSAATTRAPRTQARSWTRAAIHPYRIKHGCGSTAPRPPPPQSRSRPLHPSPCGLPATGRPQRHAQRRRRAADSTVSARKGHSATTATTRCPTGACQPDRVRRRRRPPDCKVLDPATAPCRHGHRPLPHTSPPSGPCVPATADFCPTPARPPDRVRRWRRPPDRTASAWQRLFCHERHRPLPHISTPARPCAPAAAAAAPRHHSFSLAAARCSSRHRSLPQHKDAGPTVRLSYDCHPAPPPQDDNGTLPPPPPPGAPHQPARPTIFAGGGRPPASTASVRQRHSATTETARYPRPVSLRDRVRWRRRPADSAVLAPATALCPHGRRSPRRTSTPVRSCAPAAATRQHGVAAPATARRCRRSICRWLPHVPAQRPPPISKGVDTASSP